MRRSRGIPSETNDVNLATCIAVGFEDKATLKGLDEVIFFTSVNKYTTKELEAFKAQGKKVVFGSKEQRKGALKLGESFALVDNTPFRYYRNADNTDAKHLAVGAILFPALHYADKNLLKNFDTGSPFLNEIIRNYAVKPHFKRELSPEQKEFFYQEVMKSDPEIIEVYNEFAVRLLDVVSD